MKEASSQGGILACMSFRHWFAAAQDIEVTGPEFLRAFIIGYDVAARAGIGTRLQHEHASPRHLGNTLGRRRCIGWTRIRLLIC